MEVRNVFLQRFAWFAFILEIFINIIMIFLSMFYPIDPTLKITHYSQGMLVFFLLAGMMMFQIISFYAIKNLNSRNTKWTVILLILGLIHNPLYLIPSIGKIIVKK